MESIFSNFGNFNGDTFNFGTIFKNNEISVPVQAHLSKVYTGLIACLICATLGVAADSRYNFGGGFLSSMGTLGMLWWLQKDQDKQNYSKRMGMLAAFGFMQGASIGPLVNMIMYIDPSIVMTALVGTATVFVCFSLAAMTAKRASYMYLQGVLFSALSLLFYLGLANMFFKSMFLYNIQLYGGLMLFSGFVVFDTQLVLEKAILGDRDFAGHAANLFVDFVGIFVRLLIILAKNSKKDSDKKKKSSR